MGTFTLFLITYSLNISAICSFYSFSGDSTESLKRFFISIDWFKPPADAGLAGAIMTLMRFFSRVE
jgi:hypothetical protein